jgi:hypothetical protein
MKKNLNYYYRTNVKTWILLAVASSIYFSLSTPFFIGGGFLNMSKEQIIFMDDYPTQMPMWKVVGFLVRHVLNLGHPVHNYHSSALPLLLQHQKHKIHAVSERHNERVRNV